MTRRPLVVDTNVVVAGLLTSDPSSPTAVVLDGMLDGTFLVLLSEELLSEYREVLLHPRIRERHGLEPAEIDRLLTEITLNAIVRAPAAVDIPGSDPGDTHLWGLLSCDQRALLVTGDERLHGTAPEGTTVVSARQLVDRNR